MILSALFLLTFASTVHSLTCVSGFIAHFNEGSPRRISDVRTNSLPCLNGRCASFQLTSVTFEPYSQSIDVTTMFCAPNWLLNGTTNGCTDLSASNSAEFCVCDTDDCNAGDTDPAPADTSDPPILCYEGLVSDGQLVGQTGTHLIPCFGDCYSVSLNTTLSFGQLNATLYTCMPKYLSDNGSLLYNLSIPYNFSIPEDNCNYLPEMTVCSCSFGACLDPSEKGAYPEPIANLECIRGSFIYNIYELGADITSFQVWVPCPNGMCANVITNCNSHGPGYLGQMMVERFCAPHELVQQVTGRRTGGCAFLDLEEYPLENSDHAFGCFCNNANGCNAIFETDLPPPSSAPRTLSCFSGLGYNDTVPVLSFAQCAGVCSSTTYHQDWPMPEFVTIYSCATVELCSLWNISMNTCGRVYNELLRFAKLQSTEGVDSHADPWRLSNWLDEVSGLSEVLPSGHKCHG